MSHSATQPLLQGAGQAGKTKPEARLAEKVERKVASSTPSEDVAFPVFSPTMMIVYNVPILCLLQS